MNLSERTADRRLMITQLDAIWGISEERTRSLAQHLVSKIDKDAADCVTKSHELLAGIVRELLGDSDYHEEEMPRFFKRYIDDLEDVFKYVLTGYVTQELLEQRNTLSNLKPVYDAPEDLGIDFLCRIFFDEAGSILRTRIYQRNSGITLLVRHVRNQQKHETNRPLDHITGKNTCGNIYTLASTLILSIYAYIEILELWSDIA